ncbi:MAG: hypothetical protein AW09_003052 [Candidatus Accumulibacter phosphatis]|uniref:Uncharacterized protein n=1 Tax=Candidatus Accumulibacter phosphatis TaxID=327160 RepID=A0A080M3U6_9PROT|nr:MAG: hypothetical protein AW09_003052 [Candidatus Accumulibacter phosphatis]
MPLHFQRLQIVRHCDQIHLRRQFHSRVTPIAVGEDAELSSADKSAQAFLDLGVFGLAVAGPVRQAFGEAGCLARVGLEGAGHIDPVERRKVVEVHNMVVYSMRQNDHVPYVLGVDRQFQLQGILDRAHRGNRMHCCAYATDALCDRPGIARIATNQNILDTAPHLARGPRFLDLAAVDLDINTQVTFDSRDRINRDSLRHFRVS